MGLLTSLIRKQTKQPKTTAAVPTVDNSRYRGVEIVANSRDCCQEAKAVAGQRFLSDQVPMLPLGGCTAEQCRCTYELFDDRRTDKRRASDEIFDVRSTMYENDQREKNRGRRDMD